MKAAVETPEYDSYIEDNYLQPNTAAGDEFVDYLDNNNKLLSQVIGG
jgi:putative tricarboxylic transport membrane protein